MKVVFIHRKRDGSRSMVEVDYATGRKTPIRVGPRPSRGAGGCWRRSTSQGVPIKQLAAAQKLDVELGCEVNWQNRGHVALPEFADAIQSANYLRAHKWVNHDPGYHDPCPGDFTETQ